MSKKKTNIPVEKPPISKVSPEKPDQIPEREILWELILKNDFSNEDLGSYNDTDIKSDKDWKSVKWSDFKSRSSIISASGNKKMRVQYPKGWAGSNSGGFTLVQLWQHEELYFRQTLTFEKGFDFVQGGKIPGLASGERTWTGWNIPKEGQWYSARYMWRSNGRAVLYLYHTDMPGPWWEDINLWFSFVPWKSYTLTQRIKKNSWNEKNGIIQVWMSENGWPHKKVLEKLDMRTGLNGRWYTDSLLFNTFHWWSGASWAPSVTSYAQFDDIIISTGGFSDLNTENTEQSNNGTNAPEAQVKPSPW